ncbi:MAG TPA: hypothetical protein VFA30_00085 [Gaiellaceae bacterium]|nr:hypothetical protein [Gaiellaceae bacterium]
MKRLTAATLATSALVFGASVLVGSSRASGIARPAYTCTAADRQFIQTVSSNMFQLSYWSDALTSQDADADTVATQAKAEAGQIGATRPVDRTLGATRALLQSMFMEYSKAVGASASGKDGSAHMKNAWRFAADSQHLLAGAKNGLAAKGCDVSPLLSS